MPLLAEEDRHLIATSPLMRRLRLNSRGADREAQCCRLLWSVLASMCLRQQQTGPDGGAPSVGKQASGSGSSTVSAIKPGRMISEDNSAPWSVLLGQLCESLAVRIQGAALRSGTDNSGADGGGDGGGFDPSDPKHYSDESAMARMEAQALSEARMRASAAIEHSFKGGDELDGDGGAGDEDDDDEGERRGTEEATERVKSEEAIISMLGLLVYACSENPDLAQALTSPMWLRVLLAIWHHASPRCTRLPCVYSQRSYRYARPDGVLVPNPNTISNLSQPFHLDPTGGEPLIPFPFAVVGKEELLSHTHHLAFGRHTWRPATAWQPIVDGTLSLLRRLLLSRRAGARPFSTRWLH